MASYPRILRMSENERAEIQAIEREDTLARICMDQITVLNNRIKGLICDNEVSNAYKGEAIKAMSKQIGELAATAFPFKHEPIRADTLPEEMRPRRMISIPFEEFERLHTELREAKENHRR